MNEIVKREENQMMTTGLAGVVPQTLDDAFRLGKAISMSGMTPYGMNSPEQCTVAILQGLEVGLPPMQAIQNIAVINGRPTIWGDASLAIVQKSGLCDWITEEIEGEGDDMVAVCETQRKGSPKTVVRRFSVEDAIKAGLWQTEAVVTRRKKNGETYDKENDSPWYKYPKRMLQMRARAFCLRDVYPDVLKGLQVREEVEDYAQDYRGPDNAKDITKASMAERYSKPEDNEDKPKEGFANEDIDKEINNIQSNSDSSRELLDKGDAEISEDSQSIPEEPASPLQTPEQRTKLISIVKALLKCIDNKGDTSLVAVSERMRKVSNVFINEIKSDSEKFGEEAPDKAEAIFQSIIAIVKNMRNSNDGQERDVVLSHYAEMLECEVVDFG